ncbi:hypothetical protein GQ55_1G038600 [Panicum hallii var. hallii]|uniref:Uncharacterized protein n=1 Tax=Panicum hallii var. hallii TaxID=1504633 RepID=A0A2T7F1Z8_9POAL|nr:hypothetical protein GQ55_1G038600 [Panicum hallii var. hallii]
MPKGPCFPSIFAVEAASRERVGKMEQLQGVVADQSARICDRSIEFGRLRFGVGRRSNSCKDKPSWSCPALPFPRFLLRGPCASLARSGGSSRPLTYAAASRGGGWESQRQLGTRDFELQQAATL